MNEFVGEATVCEVLNGCKRRLAIDADCEAAEVSSVLSKYDVNNCRLGFKLLYSQGEPT